MSFLNEKQVFQLTKLCKIKCSEEEQKKLVEKRRTKINSELEKNGINNLPELSKCNLEDLFSIFKKIFRADITELKIKNLVQKVIDGSRNTLDILRKNGIRI